MKSPIFHICFALAVAGILLGALLFQVVIPQAAATGTSGERLADSDFASAVPADRSVLPGKAERPTSTVRREEVGPVVSAEQRRLQQENAELRERLQAVLGWILENFRGRFPLREQYMDRVSIPSVTDDFLLHPDAIDLLKVTDDEANTINEVFAYAYDYMRELEASVLTVNQPHPDKVVLYVPPFPEEGEVVRDDLNFAIEATLGTDRYRRFMQVCKDGLESKFDRFGEAARTMIFELVAGDDQLSPQLKIKDGWVVELSEGVRSITATESVVTNLPPKYLIYLPWLPDQFAEQAAGE